MSASRIGRATIAGWIGACDGGRVGGDRQWPRDLGAALADHLDHLVARAEHEVEVVEPRAVEPSFGPVLDQCHRDQSPRHPADVAGSVEDDDRLDRRIRRRPTRRRSAPGS